MIIPSVKNKCGPPEGKKHISHRTSHIMVRIAISYSDNPRFDFRPAYRLSLNLPPQFSQGKKVFLRVSQIITRHRSIIFRCINPHSWVGVMRISHTLKHSFITEIFYHRIGEESTYIVQHIWLSGSVFVKPN
jgi:hypothetical protein